MTAVEKVHAHVVARRTAWYRSALIVAALHGLIDQPVTAATAQLDRERPSINADVDLTAGWRAYDAGDFSTAAARYRKAAMRNDRLAQFNLAVMLIAGEGGVLDAAEGLSWLRRSADAGLPRAQHALGVLYERGELLQRSQIEATAWFLKAAMQGWRDAQLSVATQYFLGRGATRDMSQAALWYERAADQGDEGAAYIVASLYERGDGVALDLPRALFWYLRAAQAGEPAAKLKAEEVRKRISSP